MQIHCECTRTRKASCHSEISVIANFPVQSPAGLLLRRWYEGQAPVRTLVWRMDRRLRNDLLRNVATRMLPVVVPRKNRAEADPPESVQSARNLIGGFSVPECPRWRELRPALGLCSDAPSASYGDGEIQMERFAVSTSLGARS